MARKVLLETTYTFTPATKTVTIPRAIPRERLILITNVTTNQVIYNFSDPNLRATSYTVSGTPNANLTTIVLNYNTASMNSADKLQFTFDEFGETFTPSEAYTDPVNKIRTSQPQALIDTDFEYGTQITKWENVGLVNNRPFAYSSPTSIPNITGIVLNNGSRLVTVTTSSAHGLTVGTPIAVQDTFLSIANGNFVIETTPSGTTFTYSARAINTTTLTALFDTNKTLLYTGSFFTGAAIGSAPTITYAAGGIGAAVTVTTTIPHGLAIGNKIAVVGTSATTNAPNGTYYVTRIISSTQFIYYVPAVPTGSVTGGLVYVLPQTQVLHRPFDGGVIFSSNATGNFEQAIRQTRRYFRYQSGKGIQVSSGTIIKPALQVDALTSSGTTVTVTTKEQHNIQPGTTITVSGANETAYNGTFAVSAITGYNTFQYTAASTPSTAIASGAFYVSITSWYGCTNRLGAFDFQNGIFFEFDGQSLYAVRRNSTYQIAGRVTATNGSCTIAGSSDFTTYFAKQLAIGDFIVIRGQSYRVSDIASDSSLTISPAYRGATASNVIVSKTVDTRIPQSQWNIDKCDGTGPSGYNIDLSRMQMFYLDYSWYGAGFVRWGFRGVDGNVFYVHKLANNNVNSEAYMRSGNLPARYETQSLPPTTALNATLNTSDTTANVLSTSGFPSSGTIVVRDNNQYEYINYTGITSTSFTGLTRQQAGGTPTVNTTVGSNVVVVSANTGIQIGQRVSSANIPDGTFVTAIAGTNITLSNAATATATGTASAFIQMGTSPTANFSYSATNPVAVEFAWPTFAPTISHWGTSAIMDGRFDDDKSLIFTYGTPNSISIAQNASNVVVSIRVAPSVDNGQTGAFGARELINRMQLTLKALDLQTDQPLLVTCVLNGLVSASTSWTSPAASGQVNSSLSQIASHAATTTITGGENCAGFFVPSGSLSLDLSNVRDLGNSTLGGGGSAANTQYYPDGPDVLHIVVRNNGSSAANVRVRLSWTEAQA
jgi:hypothetical protein